MYFPSDASGVQDPDARGKIAGCLKCKLMHTFFGAAWAYFLFCGHIFYNPLSGFAAANTLDKPFFSQFFYNSSYLSIRAV